MISIRLTHGRARQRSLYVAKGKIASVRSQLIQLTVPSYNYYGYHLTTKLRDQLSSALSLVDKALNAFNEEVGWPCKDDKA